MTGAKHTTRSPAGIWLSLGAGLLFAALLLHGPLSPDLAVQKERIADGHARWALVHWSAAVALFLMSGAGFLRLAAPAELRDPPVLQSAWVVMALGALMTCTTAVAEAAVVSEVARAGSPELFRIWWSFSGGMANGFFALALAVATIALSGAPQMPRWTSITGAVAGIGSAAGWSLGQQMGVEMGGPIWLISTLAMCLWLAWYGLKDTVLAGRAPLPRTT